MTGKTQETIGKVVLDLSRYSGKDLYSDGAVEDTLLEIARDLPAKDYEQEISQKKDWAVMYHFSPLRENILSWYPVNKTDRVLEIGSGCGAITHILAQKAGEVECVELSRKRSRINAHRNRDCQNVTIHVGNFMDIEPGLGTFDVITLIGVFEYAGSYIDSKTPFLDFLKTIRRHLSEDGVLLMAIENRLGLKYFAGAREDHSGIFFENIEGYPAGRGTRTFVRTELEQLFEEAGMFTRSFYYPYPDYKFPMAVYSDAYLPKEGESRTNMENFDRNRMLLFDESKAFDSIAQAGLYPVFANSYFVEIGTPRKKPVFVKYSNDRIGARKIRTEILKEDAGFTVRKVPMHPDAMEHLREMDAQRALLEAAFAGTRFAANRCTPDEAGLTLEYLEGQTLEEQFDALLPDGEEALLHAFWDYFDELDRLETVPFSPSGDFEKVFGKWGLPEGMDSFTVSDIDLVLNNILVTGDEWNVIDYEWTFSFLVPKDFIKWRILHYYLTGNSKRLFLDKERFFEVFGIDSSYAELFEGMEESFQTYVAGGHRTRASLYGEMSPGTIDVHRLVGLYELYGDPEASVTRLKEKGARKDAVLSQRLALSSELMNTKLIRMARKTYSVRKKEDPFTLFYPALSADPEGICFAVDKELLEADAFRVTGWCFDKAFDTSLSVINEDGKELPIKVQRGARNDVALAYGLDLAEPCGFSLTVQAADAGTEKLRLRFSSLRGFAEVMLSYEPDPEKRRKMLQYGITFPDDAYEELYRDLEKITHGSQIDAESPEPYGKEERTDAIPLKTAHRMESPDAANEGGEEETFFREWEIVNPEGCALTPWAIDCFAKAAEKHPEAMILYGDDDEQDADGKVGRPFFKPAWNEAYFAATNYIGSVFAVKKSFGIPENDNTYDFLLHAAGKTDKIVHVNTVISHRKKAFFGNTTGELAQAAQQLKEHYDRCGIEASVRIDLEKGILRTDYSITGRPLVSVLIPNKDHKEDLEKCLRSLPKDTDAFALEILVIENNSTKPETFAYYAALPDLDPRIRVVRYEGAFDYAAINNFGVQQSKGEYLLFLNNDTEFLSSESFRALLGQAMRKEVGAAGARLLYGDGTLQHAGIIIGYGNCAGHCLQGLSGKAVGYMKRAVAPMELNAVTAAVMMTRRSCFDAVGGFTRELAVAFNDVDYCLKLREQGFKIIYEPDAVLHHYESISRGYEDTPEKRARFDREKEYFAKRWTALLTKGDPFYSQALTYHRPDFSIASKEERDSEEVRYGTV